MRVPGRSPRRSRPTSADDTAPLDPVALTLAVWLGLIATVTGLVRMSENAAFQAQSNRTDTTKPLENPQAIILLGG